MGKQLTVEVILTYDNLDAMIDDAIDDVESILGAALPTSWTNNGALPRIEVAVPEDET